MTLVYRAIWEDTPPGDDAEVYVEKARRRFDAWARRPGPDGRTPEETAPEAPEGPVTDGLTSIGDREIRLSTLGEGEPGFEGVTVDQDADGNVWTTRVRLRVRVRDRVVHVAVENSVEGDDPTARIAVGRPGVVGRLLDLATQPRLGSGLLQTDVLPCPAGAVAALVEHLRDPERRLPVVVFTDRTDGGRPTSRDLAERVARRCVGVAVVVVLDGAGVTALKEQLGDLAVWGGAVRTYMPAPMETSRDAWRHRYVTADRLHEHPTGTVDRLVSATAALSTRRALPGPLSAVDVVADGMAERYAELRAESEDLQEQVVQAGVDLDETARELTRAQAHLARLQTALTQQGMAEVFWGTHDTRADDLPDDVASATLAVLVAQESLSDWSAVPDDAAQHLEGIDTAPNSYAWGNGVYRGLRALAAYAEQRADGEAGNFWRWCEQSGHPLVWPATSKKLAMSESETVTSSAKLMHARTLPVDVAVDPSGRAAMVSHLKIAEGGGDLAPRVYFLDDTGGPTRKVHVGLVGPHYLVRNTRS